jgi:hypothetical protein
MAATVYMCEGFEGFTNQFTVDGAGYGRVMDARTGRWAMGCTASSALNNSMAFLQLNTAAFGTVQSKHGSTRFYIKLMRLPSGGDGELALFAPRGASEAVEPFFLTIDSGGYIKAYTLGNGGTPTHVGTSTNPLALRTWTRIEVGLQFNTVAAQPLPNPPYESDGGFTVAVDGATEISYSAALAGSGNGVHNNAAANYFIGYAFLGLSNTRYAAYGVGTATVGDWLIDDVAVGVGTNREDFIGEGYVLGLTGTGIGTKTGWSVTPTTAEILCVDSTQLAYSGGSTGVDRLASAVALDEVSVALPTLESVGAASVPRCAVVQVMAELTGFTGKAILGVNGVFDTSKDCAAGASTYGSAYFSGASHGITAIDDALEIGIQKDNNANNRFIDHMILQVEVASYAAPDRGADIEFIQSTYTGNGTIQELITGHDADIVLISDPTGTSNAGFYILGRSVNHWPAGAFAVRGSKTTKGPSKCRLHNTGFVVIGSDLNTNAKVYSVLSIKDPGRRFVRQLSVRTQANAAGDNFDARWLEFGANDSGVPDLVLSHQQAPITVAQLQRWQYHAADECKASNSNTDANNQLANLLQDMSVDGLELGHAWATEGALHAWGFCDDTFSALPLIYAGNFTGTGAAQTISLPAPYNTLTPSMILVSPPAGQGLDSNTEYDGWWCNEHAAGRCSRMFSNSLLNAGNGITSVGVGEFGLANSAQLNANGKTYYYVVFFEGEDAFTTTAPPVVDDSDWPDGALGMLGLYVQALKYLSTPIPEFERSGQVSCEQRTFLVAAEGEADVPCDQRDFPCDKE